MLRSRRSRFRPIICSEEVTPGRNRRHGHGRVKKRLDDGPRCLCNLGPLGARALVRLSALLQRTGSITLGFNSEPTGVARTDDPNLSAGPRAKVVCEADGSPAVVVHAAERRWTVVRRSERPRSQAVRRYARGAACIRGCAQGARPTNDLGGHCRRAWVQVIGRSRQGRLNIRGRSDDAALCATTWSAQQMLGTLLSSVCTGFSMPSTSSRAASSMSSTTSFALSSLRPARPFRCRWSLLA